MILILPYRFSIKQKMLAIISDVVLDDDGGTTKVVTTIVLPELMQWLLL